MLTLKEFLEEKLRTKVSSRIDEEKMRAAADIFSTPLAEASGIPDDEASAKRHVNYHNLATSKGFEQKDSRNLRNFGAHRMHVGYVKDGPKKETLDIVHSHVNYDKKTNAKPKIQTTWTHTDHKADKTTQGEGINALTTHLGKK
jgi:hypothetical protein